MNKKMTIWGREFNIKVVFDVFTGEEILDEQKKALEAFCAVAEKLLSDPKDIKKYCLKKNKKEIGNSIDNIFKYVIPTSLLVKRDTKKHTIALLCNYRFDEEHGLAIVYENEKLIRIVSQDEV